MKRNILLVYSSLTGNTKTVGEKIYEVIDGNKKMVSIKDVEQEDLAAFDTIIIGFWVDKGTADQRSKKFIKSLRQKNIIYFGTLAAYVDSKHARNVKTRVEALCSAHNNFLGVFLCQGKVDPHFSAKLNKFPLKLIHQLVGLKMETLEEAEKHPNEVDFAQAQSFVKEILEKL